MDCVKTNLRRDEKHLRFGIWCALYKRFDGIYCIFLSSLSSDLLAYVLWIEAIVWEQQQCIRIPFMLTKIRFRTVSGLLTKLYSYSLATWGGGGGGDLLLTFAALCKCRFQYKFLMWHKRNYLRLDSVGHIKNKQVFSIALFYGFPNGPRDPHLNCYLWIYLIYGLHILKFYVIWGRYMWDCTTTQKFTIITIIVIYFSFTQTHSVNNSVRYLWYKYMTLSWIHTYSKSWEDLSCILRMTV